MTTYYVTDNHYGDDTIEAESLEEAKELAIDSWEACDWGPGNTYLILRIWADPDDEEPLLSFDHIIEEEEPECCEAEHEWVEHYAARCNGGGVYYTDRCMHCGIRKNVNTWAQNPETGEQGFDETTYDPPESIEEDA